MRKIAGFMLALLLLVPALASAWTLQGAVQGPNGSGQISINTIPAKVITIGSSYVAVATGVDAVVTFTPSGTNAVSKVVVDGVTLGSVPASPYTIANSGTSHSIVVTFAAPTYTVTASQVAGGTVTIQQTAPLVSGTSQTSLAGIKTGATFKVTASPTFDKKVTSITIDGIVTPFTDVAGVAKSMTFTVSKSQTVTAAFSLVPNYSLVLAAPGNSAASSAVTVDASGTTSNDAGLQFAFAVTGPATFTQAASATPTFVFTPTVAGTYTVTLTATSTNPLPSPPLNTKAATIVVAPPTDANLICTNCHSGNSTVLVDAYNASIHFANSVGCQNCHSAVPHNAGVTPQCVTCHAGATPPTTAAFASGCAACHGGNGTGVHSVSLTPAPFGCPSCHSDGTPAGNTDHIAKSTGGCIGCHDTGAPPHAGKVNDNSGVRAITTEFAKWSHHVTGVTLQNAHCAACHLEGKADNGTIVVDNTYHMADAQTHLRNADTDADMAWNPATPNHTTMDNFCMSCHDANGATSDGSKAIQAVIIPATGKTASASNPFGDTISNRYDKMQRPAVVDASGQFDPSNNSHHAVKLNKYSGRTRVAGPRQITGAATFAANSSAALYGKRSTIYDAGNFNQLYVPLVNAGGETAPRTGAATLGDDSTLHCGDCHTVGQFKPNATVNAAGTAVATVIGAHGSNNEYLLRNSIGTDARHTQNAVTVLAGINTVTNPNGAYLVCFNCHAFTKYGSVFGATGAGGGHAGEYASGGRCNGPGNTLSFNGYTTGAATDGTQFGSRFTLPAPLTGQPGYAGYAGEQNPDFGNVYGIQCANCHNSGVENGYGGIHGSKVNTYTDGMGMTNKMTHFLPGLGNSKYVPGTLGGFSGTTQHNYSSATSKKYSVIGDVSNDTNWEQKQSKPNQGTPGQATDATGAVIQRGAGCYTLGEGTAATLDQKGLSVDGGATTPNALGTWGGCEDHNAASGAGDHGTFKKIVRPVTY